MQSELTILFEKIKKLGPDGLRSLAYDYKDGGVGQTFVQNNSYKILQMTDEQWIEAAAKTTKIGDVDFTVTPTTQEIQIMKDQTLSNAFSTNNSDVLEAEMLEWFTGLAETQYNETEAKVSSDDRKGIRLTTGNYYRFEDIPSDANILAGNTDDASRTIAIENIIYRYKNGKFEYNYPGAYMPVPEVAGGKEGSGKSLFFLLGKRPEFSFLNEAQYNK